jgi:integrase
VNEESCEVGVSARPCRRSLIRLAHLREKWSIPVPGRGHWQGIGRWHLHELRHSGASLMLAQGTDLYVVSEVLGHSSVAITKTSMASRRPEAHNR